MSDQYKFLQNLEKSKLRIVLVCVFIFVSSLAVSYLPLHKKGISFGNIIDNLILARNLGETGQFSLENEKNVILSVQDISEQGIPSELGNKLTPILHSYIFNLFGFNQSLPNIVTSILFALSLVILFLLMLTLFDLKTALLFCFLTLFLPLFVQSSMRAGLYGWAFLFLNLGLLFYFLKTKPTFLWLMLSSGFLALSFWARNSFLVIFLILLVWEIWQKKSLKRIILFGLPFLLIVCVPFISNYTTRGLNNAYLSSKETTSSFMHLFPDAYTWHFERDEYVQNLGQTSNYDYNQFLIKYGYKISLKNKILMYWSSAQSYLRGFFAMTVWGGAVVLFLVGVGIAVLYNRKRELLKFFAVWFVIWYLFLILAKSNHWGHFLLLLWPAVTLASLGLRKIFEVIKNQQLKEIHKKILILAVLATLFLNFVHANKWSFHELYENSSIEAAQGLAGRVNEANLGDQDVIAVGLRNPATLQINWQTNINAVYFAPQTIKKLLKENKLRWAFEQFSVTGVVGYEKELTQDIEKQVNVRVL